MAIELFGFEIKRKSDETSNTEIKSFVSSDEDQGANSMSVVSTPSGGGAISSVIDLENAAKSEAELILKYRTMLQQPEVQAAIDDIINEAISTNNCRRE